MDKDAIFALDRPHPSLLKLYIIRSVFAGPFFFVVLPILLFRYYTLRYRFDDQGVHMQWGVLFRREVNLTYARIQDIHLRSGFIQRWFGLADLLVQTASGSALPEMTIEGFKQYEEIRDFFYKRMRGSRERGRALAEQPPAAGSDPATAAVSGFPAPASVSGGGDEVVSLLLEIRDELHRTREELERRRGGG